MQKKQCVPMYGSKCNIPNSVMLFTKHYLKNYWYKSNNCYKSTIICRFSGITYFKPI